MAFKSVKNYNPFFSKMDPRVDSRWAINSNYMVMAVTHHKTYDSLIASGKSIADLKIMGLISDHAVSENTNIAQFYEIGNKRPIHIPGKTNGRLSLSSEIIESVNLLGGIYETVIAGMKNDLALGRAMKDLDENVMFHPLLNEAYYEGSDNGSPIDDIGGGIINDITDPNFSYSQLEKRNALAVTATPASQGGGSNQGALLLSINDVRLKIKFGLCFLLFQNSKRLINDSVDGNFSTDSPFPKPDQFDFENMPATSFEDVEDFGDLGDKYTDSYRILGGVFFENCLITDYNRSANTQQLGNNYSEQLNVVFNGTRNIQPAKKRDVPSN